MYFETFQSIIYYTVRSTKLETWLENESIRDSLQPTLDKNYVDLDPTFASSVDEDYDHRLSGVSKNSFTNIYLDWIQYCASHRDKVLSCWTLLVNFKLSQAWYSRYLHAQTLTIHPFCWTNFCRPAFSMCLLLSTFMFMLCTRFLEKICFHLSVCKVYRCCWQVQISS